MELRQEIKDRIINDNLFSLELAYLLNRKQESLVRAAGRENTPDILTNYAAIVFFKKKGYSEAEIFESEPSENSN